LTGQGSARNCFTAAPPERRSRCAGLPHRHRLSDTTQWRPRLGRANDLRGAIQTAATLVIIGATDTTEALASAAAAIGWKTICVDARASFATSERMPSADTLLVKWPAEALAEVAPDEETAIVIVTHDEKFTVPP